MWHVYMLRCSDGSIYTGITVDVDARLKRHNSGKGSKYVRSKRPAELVYIEDFHTKGEARNREIEVKQFSAENKKKLVMHGKGQRFPSAAI